MDEITKDQPISESEASQEEPAESPASLSPEQEESQLDVVPEKFLGKGAPEIIKSYTSLESQFSKVSSEKAAAEKRQAELEARIAELESAPKAEQAPEEQELNPLETYDEDFEEDPKEAIRKVLEHSEKSRRQEQQRLQEQQANEYWQQQAQSDEEFNELQSEMDKVAKEFGDLLNPNSIYDKRVIDLTYLVAQARTREKFAQAYAEKLKEDKSALEQEKRSASAVESSSESGTVGGKSLKDMTTAELEAYFGFADK